MERTLTSRHGAADPRNVIEGKRPLDITGAANAPVSQTPTQAALARLAAEESRRNVRREKMLTAAVSVPVQTASDTVGGAQTLAAAVAKALSSRTEAVSNQLGITDFNNAVRVCDRDLPTTRVSHTCRHSQDPGCTGRREGKRNRARSVQTVL